MKRIISAAVVSCFLIALFAGAKVSANKANDSSEIDRLAEMIAAENPGSKERTNDGEYFVTWLKNDRLKDKKVGIDDIAFAGKSILITKDEISYGEMFYLAGGDSQKEAHEKAVKYYKENDAMYVKALRAGFDADEEEVKNYVESFREMSKTAANSEDVMKIVNAYPSEDYYWEYMLEVYKKQLPVQKYVASLQKNFLQREVWDKKFAWIKEEAAKEEAFTDRFSEADLTGFLAK